MNCEHPYNYLSFCCKCTRDEFMAFSVHAVRKPVWTTVLGGAVIACGAATVVLEQGQISALALMLIFLGALLMLFSPLILPMFLKGEAAKRYDDKKGELQSVITVTIKDNVLSFTSPSREGTIPLEELTEITNSEKAKVMSLSFGDEATLLIPWRALTDDEYGTLMSILQPHFQRLT